MITDKPRSGHQTLIKYYRKYRGHFIGGFVVLVCSNAFALVAPWLLKEGIDAVSFVGSIATGGPKTSISWRSDVRSLWCAVGNHQNDSAKVCGCDRGVGSRRRILPILFSSNHHLGVAPYRI